MSNESAEGTGSEKNVVDGPQKTTKPRTLATTCSLSVHQVAVTLIDPALLSTIGLTTTPSSQATVHVRPAPALTLVQTRV